MRENVFREYDIRGIVGSELHLDKIRDLGKAILTYFLKQDPNLSHIVVGMDGRVHSPFIKEEIVTAANQLGIRVTDIGLCPTPVFYFTLFNADKRNKSHLPVGTSGLMITASHNPKQYNGIKICFNKKSVWGTQIKEIKNIFETKNFAQDKPISSATNQNYDAITPYLEWMTSHFDHLKNKDIKAIIDCGNGTAGKVFPQLIEMMGFKNTKILFEEVDGTFPNHDADPTNIKNMLDVKEALLELNHESDPLVVGLGLDGDCDRMNPMTQSGDLIPGDQMLAIYSKKIVLDKHKTKPVIVFDIKSSDALVQALEEMGATPCIAPSGHSIIKEYLYKNEAKLGGELSCHFFFNDRYFGYDDGIYAALRLFELLDETQQSLEELVEALPTRVSSPEHRIACAEKDKAKIVEHAKTFFSAKKDVKMLTIDGIRATTSYGWGLLRASNTQAVICLRFESKTHEGLQKLQDDFNQILLEYFDQKTLREYFG